MINDLEYYAADGALLGEFFREGHFAALTPNGETWPNKPWPLPKAFYHSLLLISKSQDGNEAGDSYSIVYHPSFCVKPSRLVHRVVGGICFSDRIFIESMTDAAYLSDFNWLQGGSLPVENVSEDRFYESLSGLSGDPKRCDQVIGQTLKSIWEKSHLGQIDDHRVKRAREVMPQLFSEAGTVEAVSRSVGMSRSHFSRLFSRHMKISPTAYLKEMKLAWVKTRLAQKGKCSSLAKLADDCGFSDQPHMTRVFKDRFGMTPAVYERLIINSNK